MAECGSGHSCGTVHRFHPAEWSAPVFAVVTLGTVSRVLHVQAEFCPGWRFHKALWCDLDFSVESAYLRVLPLPKPFPHEPDPPLAPSPESKRQKKLSEKRSRLPPKLPEQNRLSEAAETASLVERRAEARRGVA